MWTPWKKDRKLTIDPDWVPPPDPVFQYLLERSLVGAVPVYFGSLPPGLVRPFSDAFHPENSPKGQEVVRGIMQSWRVGEFAKIWVYEREGQFVASDDYFTLAATRLGDPDLIPAWILGDPVTKVRDLQGPLTVEGVRDLLGLGDHV